MLFRSRTGSHIGVDILVQQLRPGGRRAVGILVSLLSILYAVILLTGCYNYIDTMHTLGIEAEDIPVEKWILLLALPLGFALLLVRLVQAAWMIITGRHHGVLLADEARDAVEQFADPEARRP